MITQSNFLLMANRDGSLPPFIGHLIRAAFSNLIESQDKDVAEGFHKTNEIRPYSINRVGFCPKRKLEDRGIALRKNDKVQLSMSFFSDKIIETLFDIFSDRQPLIYLNSVPLTMINMMVNKTEPIDLIKSARKVSRFTFFFKTPTQFKMGLGYPIFFPEPVLIFSSLAKSWNKFFDIKIDTDLLLDAISKNVFVRDFSNLSTRTVKLGKSHPTVGFVGRCSYVVKDIENSNLVWLDILARFGEYANVGKKRTAGLGVIQYNRS